MLNIFLRIMKTSILLMPIIIFNTEMMAFNTTDRYATLRIRTVKMTHRLSMNVCKIIESTIIALMNFGS